MTGVASGSRLTIAAALVALGVAAAHLPALPSTLEDIDSVNFALGVRDFDPAQHRPHPPGYPVYIALGKAATAVTGMTWPDGRADRVEARALAALSLIGALLAAWWLPRVASALAAGGEDRLGAPPLSRRALLATLLAVTAPLAWYMASRPMSDVPGLAASLASLVFLGAAWWRQRPGPDGDRRLAPAAMAASGRAIVLGALLAGFAVGFRSQTLWLTAPFLLLVLADRLGRGVAGAVLGSSIAFAAGALAWAIPLVIASGGPQAYLAALGAQAGEDFAGVEMLWLNPTPRAAAFALLRTFVWPWDSAALAGVVLVLAAGGALLLLIRERRTFAAVAALGIPYAAFHLAFQDTTFARYALPLVWPVAFLAAVALDAAGRAGAVAGVALAAWSLTIAVPQLSAYVAQGSPTARLFDRVTDAAAQTSPAPAVAMHQALRRPLEAEPRPVGTLLPSPPRREWLELARYWQSAAGGPVWLLADLRRTDLALVDPQARRDVERFAWDGVTSLSMLGGMRPGGVEWYRLAEPGWFALEGWSLTPETAGMARLMGQGPHLAPIHAAVRRRSEPVRLLVGGRHLGAAGDPPVTFTVTLDGRAVETWSQEPGFFVRTFDLAAGALDGPGRLADLAIGSTAAGGTAVPTSIEQFDVQSPGVTMWAYGPGFYEPELDNQQGRAWRWMGAEAAIEVAQAGGDVTLVVEGESPLRYFDQPSSVEIHHGDVRIAQATLAGDFTLRVGVPASRLEGADRVLRFTTSQTFSPSERGASRDPRRLGLRLFRVALVPGLPSR